MWTTLEPIPRCPLPACSSTLLTHKCKPAFVKCSSFWLYAPQVIFQSKGHWGKSVYMQSITKCCFPMLHRAQPLWYRADSPELLQGSSVLLVDKGTRMAGCSFLCSLSQATGSFWWYWICCLRQVQDSRSNNSHPLRQESGLAGMRNLQRIGWKRVLHSILMQTTKYSCLCYFFQLYNQVPLRSTTPGALLSLEADRWTRVRTGVRTHLWYNRGDVDNILSKTLKVKSGTTRMLTIGTIHAICTIGTIEVSTIGTIDTIEELYNRDVDHILSKK